MSLGGSSPTANRKLEDRAQSPEMPIRPNNYLPLTICRTDPWQADVLDSEPSVVTKTEHELSVSDIIASRHGKTVLNKLTAGQPQVAQRCNSTHFTRHQPQNAREFSVFMRLLKLLLRSDDLAYTEQFVRSPAYPFYPLCFCSKNAKNQCCRL